MPFLSKVIRFWNNLFRRRQVEVDLDDELQSYMEEMVERKIHAGFAPETARETVLLEVGGIERIKDFVRQQRIGFGNPRRAGVMIIVALIAFIGGAGAAVGIMRWQSPTPVAPSTAATPIKGSLSHERPPVLEGRVVDDATGQPIPGVEIGLRETPTRRYTFTDDTGHFIFSNPPSQFYWLEAGKQHWTLNQVSPVLPGNIGASVYGDFFEFAPSAAVSVKSKDGQPLKGEQMSSSHLELRQFRYSNSVVELRGVNLSPGKIANLGTTTSTLERVR